MPRSNTDRLLALALLCALTHAQAPALARQSHTRPRRVNPEASSPATGKRQSDKTTPPDAPSPSAEAARPDPVAPRRGTGADRPDSAADRREGHADRDAGAADREAPEVGPPAPEARWPVGEGALGPQAAAPPIESLKGGEPLVRVGLATDARSVVVSTAGRLLSVEAEGALPTLVEAARVRVEPRAYAPLAPPAPPFDEGAASAGSEQAKLRTRPASGQPAARPGQPSMKGAVKLTSRLSAALRGAAVFAADEQEPRLDARGPVTLAPADEGSGLVVYGGKPYRGRIEVFANTRGTLTVVNVVGLEDYVRGVVANELSPGGWPAIEALKAQAVAARTYAVSNAGRFRSQGFDLLPTTRSQVYGGRSTEHPLTDRAVAETRGLVATHAGRPINALYTSTCGGRTENAEDIFGGEPVPYLRARECAAGHAHPFEPHALRTTRELPDVRAAEHAESGRDAALLAAHGLRLPPRLTDDWLAAPLSVNEARQLTELAAALARQARPAVTSETTRPAGFASALAAALDGESRAAALLNGADVDYLLSFRDAAEVPEANRADVALLLRDGVLRLYPDATLRPRQPLTRARALGTAAAALGARGLLRLQKGTARPAEGGALVLAPAGGKGQARSLKLSAGAFLFRVFGGLAFPAREVAVVGGEPVVYHLSQAGEVDYLEVSPARSGAASDRFSKFSNWSETVSAPALVTRLGRAAAGVGELEDVRVRRRGASGRVLDLELVGTLGTAHVRGGRIRTALGLREQLFVVERERDEAGRILRYTFAGRGWGHGVGMCQVGAYGLARSGAGYEQILKAYYTGVGLTRLY